MAGYSTLVDYSKKSAANNSHLQKVMTSYIEQNPATTSNSQLQQVKTNHNKQQSATTRQNQLYTTTINITQQTTAAANNSQLLQTTVLQATVSHIEQQSVTTSAKNLPVTVSNSQTK